MTIVGINDNANERLGRCRLRPLAGSHDPRLVLCVAARIDDSPVIPASALGAVARDLRAPTGTAVVEKLLRRNLVNTNTNYNGDNTLTVHFLKGYLL